MVRVKALSCLAMINEGEGVMLIVDKGMMVTMDKSKGKKDGQGWS